VVLSLAALLMPTDMLFPKTFEVFPVNQTSKVFCVWRAVVLSQTALLLRTDVVITKTFEVFPTYPTLMFYE